MHVDLVRLWSWGFKTAYGWHAGESNQRSALKGAKIDGVRVEMSTWQDQIQEKYHKLARLDGSKTFWTILPWFAVYTRQAVGSQSKAWTTSASTVLLDKDRCKPPIMQPVSETYIDTNEPLPIPL